MSYNKNNNYEIQSQLEGWNRIDMLLTVYEKAIVSIRASQTADKAKDTCEFGKRMLDAQKCILAIYSGLRTEEDEVAANIARLLGYVLYKLEQKDFEESTKILDELHTSFKKIRSEAVGLEESGVIPPFHIKSSSFIEELA